MSTDLIKSIPITEIMSIGKAFVESGMFPDVKSVAQAVVKIQAGQEIGIQPFAAMSGIFIIQGRATVGAGVIASKIKGSGKYDYRVIKHDETVCSIDFLQGKTNIGNSTFTIEDARKAGTKNMDKFPKNMLFARCISNGVKWFCPDVFNQAVYTPEEMEGVTEDVPHEEVKAETNGNGKTMHIAEESNTPFKDEGKWIAKLEVCKKQADVLALYKANQPTVDAHPEIQKLFKERQTILATPKKQTA